MRRKRFILSTAVYKMDSHIFELKSDWIDIEESREVCSERSGRVAPGEKL